MTETDRNLMESVLDTMKNLQTELGSFRGEMKEFKNSIKQRVSELENTSRQCQMNPQTCANARRLEEHLKNHGGSFTKVFTALSFGTAFIGMAISVLAFVTKNGK